MYDQEDPKITDQPVETDEILSVEPMVDQEEDFTRLTTSERSSFLRRIIVALSASILFVIFSQFDPNHVFNPVMSSVFQLMGFVVFVLSVVFLVSYLKTNQNHFEKRMVYLQTRRQNGMMEFLVVLPVLMLMFTVMNMFVFSFSPISGSSMEPNFHDTEAVVFTHMSKDYERFDVIIIYVEELVDPYLIKRIIGLPGETVVINNNEIYVDGVLLEQTFLDQDVVKTYCYSKTDLNYCEFLVPEDSYFVLGDNRDGNGVPGAPTGYSIDSRIFGFVHRDDTYGKVVYAFKDFNIFD